MATSTLEGLESTVDSRLEENAMLQSELDEQAAAAQQLKEELKGLSGVCM